MSCVPIPIPALPDFPTGLDLTPPATPPFSGDINVCCKLVSFAIPSIPIVPPISINSAALAALNAKKSLVQAWLNSIAIDCPRQ